MIKNIVFDWSGVISDDFEIVYHTVRSIFQDYNPDPITFSHFQDVVDAPFQLYLEKLAVDQPSIPQKFADHERTHELFNRYFSHFGPPSPIKGATAIIPKLHAQKFNMAVFSSHHQHFIEAENKSFFNGNSYFSTIFGNAGNKLNSIAALIEKTKFNPKETLYVGDTTNDIEAGKSIGMTTAAVLSGYHMQEKLEIAKPSFILTSVSQLPQLLSQSIPSQPQDQ